MTGPITFELISFFIVVIGALASAGWFLIKSTLNVRREAQQEIQALRKEFTDYKLEVAQNYASHEHLKEVEVRIMSELGRQNDKLDTMPDRFARIVQHALSKD